MKEFIRKHKIILGFIAVFLTVVIVPVLINESYKYNIPAYTTMWNASDVLSFYGTILAALGGAIGVFATIVYAQRQYREDKRRDVLPYLAVDVLRRKCVNKAKEMQFGPVPGALERIKDEYYDSLTYKEYKTEHIYFVVSGEAIKYQIELTDKQTSNVKYIMQNEIEGNKTGCWREGAFYLPHEILNVGNGCAINLKAEFKMLDSTLTADSLPIQLPVNDKLYIGIYMETGDITPGNYEFELTYEDIYGNQYRQSKIIKIEKCQTWFNISESFNMEQKLICKSIK